MVPKIKLTRQLRPGGLAVMPLILRPHTQGITPQYLNTTTSVAGRRKVVPSRSPTLPSRVYASQPQRRRARQPALDPSAPETGFVDRLIHACGHPRPVPHRLTIKKTGHPPFSTPIPLSPMTRAARMIRSSPSWPPGRRDASDPEAVAVVRRLGCFTLTLWYPPAPAPPLPPVPPQPVLQTCALPSRSSSLS